MLGFELLRHRGERWNLVTTLVIAVVLAFYAQIKFTDFMLATFIVAVAGGYRQWRKQWRESLLLVGAYVVAYLAIWVLCGQHLGNLPAYFQGSWAISQGYQWAMGFPTPLAPLWKGIVVLLALIAYGAAHLKLNPDRPRAVANALLLAAFVYLNWKHGFVRADGHMIGFFYCALLPLTAYPGLLDDPDRFRRLHRGVFLFLIVLSVWATEDALPGLVRSAMGRLEETVWGNVQSSLQWGVTRQRYRDALNAERKNADIYQTREQVGRATVDVMGVDQNVAILNRLNYRPRPVIQSYSTFMPLLAQLNYDFYASEQAPEFVLLKIQTIDGRLPMMDDSLAFRLLPFRYEFVRSEKGFLIWKKKPGAFDASKYEPRLVHAESMAYDQPFKLTAWNRHPLWLKVDFDPSLLGALRSFLYKPPQVTLAVKGTNGMVRKFLMPLPMGRTGFLINPFCDDPASYMEFTDSRSKRLVESVSLEVAPDDRKFFSSTVHYELSELPAPASGSKYFASIYGNMFHMFLTYPVTYEAQNPFSEVVINGRDVAIMHAPSLMTFDMVPGAQFVRGRFGFMAGAYSAGGRTNGAEFVIYWSNGADRIELFKRFLDPLNNVNDQGLQTFEASLQGVPRDGHIYLQVKPGPYNDFSWDWTGWTDIEIK
jgi:hypothetical protein